MKSLRDSQIAFLFALLGFAITIVLVHVMMQQQGVMFAKMTIVPFLLLTLIIGFWLTPRVAKAKTKIKAMLWAMLAATLIGVLTAMIGFASSIAYQTMSGNSEAINNLWPMILYYALGGFIYCLPAILIGGGLVGATIYKRHH